MTKRFDVLIIGAGPGGYVCAIRCAQLGLKVAVVERRDTLGGTCLNVGCIPSKALLHVSERFHEAQTHFAEMGIVGCTPRIDIAQMMAFKQQVVQANVRGLASLFKKNGIEHIDGNARIVAPDVVEIRGGAKGRGKAKKVQAGAIVIATGSAPAPLPGVEVDGERVITSTEALSLPEVPASLAVIGGGVIGLELGSVWRRLGAEVTIIEYADAILPGWDADIAKTLTRELKKRGAKILTGRAVTAARADNGAALVEMRQRNSGGNDKAETLRAERALLATGRRPFTDDLGLENVGIKPDEAGFIPVNDAFETACKGIYAIGDVIGQPMLAHKAEEEGMALAALLAGQKEHALVNYAAIPSVLYTLPEAASVGFTEEELKAADVAHAKGTFHFMANGRARAMNATAGFVKILAHKDTGRLLGAHILGPMAGELIHEVAALLARQATATDLAHACHAHPTLSEAVREAALAAIDRPIHA